MPDLFAEPTWVESFYYGITAFGRILLKIGAVLLLAYLLTLCCTLLVWKLTHRQAGASSHRAAARSRRDEVSIGAQVRPRRAATISIRSHGEETGSGVGQFEQEEVVAGSRGGRP